MPNGVELASGKVAELVKSFEHVNEILDGFRYKMGAYPLNSTPFGFMPVGQQLAATQLATNVGCSPSGLSGRKQRFCEYRSSRASAGTGPTESSKQSASQGSCQLLPPPGQAGRKAIRHRYRRNKNWSSKTYVNRQLLTPQPQAQWCFSSLPIT